METRLTKLLRLTINRFHPTILKGKQKRFSKQKQMFEKQLKKYFLADPIFRKGLFNILPQINLDEMNSTFVLKTFTALKIANLTNQQKIFWQHSI